MDEELDARFVCPICCEVLKKPNKLKKCGHRFCESCLQRTPPASDGSTHCSMCRVPFHMKTDASHDSELENEIATTTIVCSGCVQQFSLMHFNSHSVTCSKRKPRPPPTFAPVGHTSQPRPSPVNRSTFACPLCNERHLDCRALCEHVDKLHANSKEAVVCPICASMPWGNPDQTSQNFVGHLNLRHKFEYDTFVDYEQDDDVALQAALEASQFER